MKMNTMLAISLITVAFLIGSVAGYYISPTYQQSMYAKDNMGLGNADRYLDLRYLNSMIAHHRGAMLIAQQAVNTSKREEIINLSREILTNEPKLIEKLYLLKKRLYNDGRRVQDPRVTKLGEVNETYDLRFLNFLIFHHEEGISMTKELRSKSTNSTIIDDANAVENFLTSTLPTLKSWRIEWFGIK